MPVQWSPRLELCPRFVKVDVHELLQLSRRAGRRQVVERGQNHICRKTGAITAAGSRNVSATYLEAAAASCPRSACHRQRVWPSGLGAGRARCSRSRWKRQGNVCVLFLISTCETIHPTGIKRGATHLSHGGPAPLPPLRSTSTATATCTVIGLKPD